MIPCFARGFLRGALVLALAATTAAAGATAAQAASPRLSLTALAFEQTTVDASSGSVADALTWRPSTRRSRRPRARSSAVRASSSCNSSRATRAGLTCTWATARTPSGTRSGCRTSSPGRLQQRGRPLDVQESRVVAVHRDVERRRERRQLRHHPTEVDNWRDTAAGTISFDLAGARKGVSSIGLDFDDFGCNQAGSPSLAGTTVTVKFTMHARTDACTLRS